MGDIYLIGNAHLDPVWLWHWQEGFTEVLATFRSALDRMKDFDDFKFTSACAVYYQWVEKADPQMFAEIQERVKEGRWNIVGGWFLQPDCNMPAGESFARHALISQRYFQEKFGLMATCGYNVDSFGHNAALPKILKASGMDNYIFMRPMPHENETLDDVFEWESADGSKVTTFRIPWFYNIDDSRLHLIAELKKKSEEDGRDYMAFYGVGNHGGGPTIDIIEKLHQSEVPGLIFSTVDEYSQKADLGECRTIKGELQNHARGCYSACSFVKKSNRKCENNLLLAEKLAFMAEKLTGLPYPKKRLEKAWKNVLFNQFHDILCGCSVEGAYEDAGYLYGETMSITEQIIHLSMQKIGRSIDTLMGETLPMYKDSKHWKHWLNEVVPVPVVIFNPYSWEVTQTVQINAIADCVLDASGAEIPFQIVRGEQTNGADDKFNTTFSATVPAFGYVVYRFWYDKKPQTQVENPLKIEETVLENEKIRVEFDRMTGDIKRFWNKATNEEIISKACSAILLDETSCDTWAHDKKYLGEKVGMFTNPEFKIMEQGPVRAMLRVTTTSGKSTLRRDYYLTADSDRIVVKAAVDFHEKHKVLKIAFPIGDAPILSQIPYGTIERAQNTGEEFCQSFTAAGKLCVANDGQYGYDSAENELRLTILRGAIYADHFGERDDFCEYMEQGVQKFSYSVAPFTTKAAAFRQAEELNVPVRCLVDSFHAGDLPERMSGLELDADNLIVTAIKKAEDEDATVLRFFEAEGKDASAKLRLYEQEAKITIGHDGVKTLKLTGAECQEIDFIER